VVALKDETAALDGRAAGSVDDTNVIEDDRARLRRRHGHGGRSNQYQWQPTKVLAHRVRL
jgi:hypothetical protein